MSQCDSIAVPQALQFNWRLSSKGGRKKPKYIVVAFQTDWSGDQTHNAAVFDHCRLRNIHVKLNAERYPAVDYKVDFNQNKVARVFKEAFDFRKKFYNMDFLLRNGDTNPSDFIDLYPLFVFDVSHRSERLKESSMDIRIRADFSHNVPANTEAFALVISDRILQFESDGQKMNVVY